MKCNKIAVDARGFFSDEPRGHIKACLEIYRQLLARNPKTRFYFYSYPFNSSETKNLITDNSEIVILDPIGSSLIDYNFLWLNVYLPISMFVKGIKLLHSTCNRVPLITSAKICSNVYDIIPLTSSGTNNLILHRHYKNVLDKSDLIITCSQYTKEQILSLFGAKYEDKIKVVYLAPTLTNSVLNSKEATKVLSKMKITGEYMFTLAHEAHPRKNIERVIRSFHTYLEDSKASTTLVVPGVSNKDAIKYYQSICKDLSILNNVIFPGYVSEFELSVLYKHALCFIYLSLDEGFGIPPLDAMSIGCPVIASNTTAIKEVVASGGVLINPLNNDDISNSFKQIKNNIILREQLILAGFENLKRFSWKQAALQYENIFLT